MLDSNRLKQILINLVQNAIKFSKNYSIVVIIASATTLTQNEVKMELKVRDHGIGISKID
jgi:signal transduction histidine kinase